MPVTECIAVYIRLSSEDNDVDGSIKAESNSVSAQRMLINEFIKKQDEFINCSVVEYVDDGYSGTNFNRPGFQRMMEDAKAGRIKSIVIKDFSRFGRDYLEVGNYLEKILPVLGIRIISINDGFDSINSSGFTGGMSVALKNMLNAMYSRDLSRKVRSAMKTHAKNGEYMPAFQKYGYIAFSYECIRHLDGNRTNNILENIEIGSYSDNQLDKSPEERKREATIASHSHIMKWNEEEVAMIKNYHKTSHSYRKTMTRFGISSKGTLHFILKNR